MGGGGATGGLPGAQGRRTARLANHQARMATLAVDVRGISNLQSTMKKMWVMTRRERRAPSEWARRKKPRAALWAGVALALLSGNKSPAQTATVSLVPDADTFVRALVPAGNYGGGG